MSYLLRYHPKVAAEDLDDIPVNIRQRIARSIDARLTSSPVQYGAPLKGSLKGYRKLRVGDYRVVFKIAGSEVWILSILHRKDVYERAGSRTAWRPRG
jgi:mRNA interferase RelE/StbE